MIIGYIVDGQNAATRIVAEWKIQGYAPAVAAPMCLQTRQQRLCRLRLEILVGALRKGTEVARAIHLLARSRGASARVRQGRLQVCIDGTARAAEEGAATIDAEGAGFEVGGRIICGGGHSGGGSEGQKKSGNEVIDEGIHFRTFDIGLLGLGHFD